ncbi:MAG: hypothetical protein LJF04_01730 [Gemmatimonadetes bacterium]|nr:hypothetical protein [Gemmatimonadota bacterium]
MTSADADRRQEAKANELYWGSDLSVNQIAEELDLSKGTLYGLIRPRPTGLACPACDEELIHPNRTARERAMVACTVCGWEGAEEDVDTFDSAGVVLPSDADETGAASSAPALDDRSRTIIGGALLGAAAGLALVLWARRR